MEDAEERQKGKIKDFFIKLIRPSIPKDSGKLIRCWIVAITQRNCFFYWTDFVRSTACIIRSAGSCRPILVRNVVNVGNFNELIGTSVQVKVRELCF